MSKAPRRVEAAVPAPAQAPRSKGSKNPKAARFWHQGFIVQRGNRVPFLHEDTARRIAAQATKNLKVPMTVAHEPDGDYWYYTPAAVPPQREEA